MSKQPREKHRRTVKATTTVIRHMYTRHEGNYEIGVMIDGKEYTYYLSSEYAVRMFENHVTKGRYGKAITILNQHKGDKIW